METTLDTLLSLSTENEVVEFKEAKNQIDKDKLGKYFSALGNEANLSNNSCAWLLLGVNNNKKIIGTNISDTQLNEYKQEIAKHTSPTTNFINTHRVTKNGLEVIMLQIPIAPKGIPLSWKGHCYCSICNCTFYGKFCFI